MYLAVKKLFISMALEQKHVLACIALLFDEENDKDDTQIKSIKFMLTTVTKT